jgi:hypothetical protein
VKSSRRVKVFLLFSTFSGAINLGAISRGICLCFLAGVSSDSLFGGRELGRRVEKNSWGALMCFCLGLLVVVCFRRF